MTQLGMIGLGFSILMAWVKRWFHTTPTAKTPNNPAVHAYPLCYLYAGLQCQYGSGSVSLFLMIAFYALSGFFRVPAVRAVTPPSPNGRRVVKRDIPRFLEYFSQPWRCRRSSVALFGANYLFDGHVIGMFISRRLSR